MMVSGLIWRKVSGGGGGGGGGGSSDNSNANRRQNSKRGHGYDTKGEPRGKLLKFQGKR